MAKATTSIDTGNRLFRGLHSLGYFYRALPPKANDRGGRRVRTFAEPISAGTWVARLARGGEVYGSYEKGELLLVTAQGRIASRKARVAIMKLLTSDECHLLHLFGVRL